MCDSILRSLKFAATEESGSDLNISKFPLMEDFACTFHVFILPQSYLAGSVNSGMEDAQQRAIARAISGKRMFLVSKAKSVFQPCSRNLVYILREAMRSRDW